MIPSKGDTVWTHATVRPKRYAGRRGRVFEFNLRSNEIGLRFSAAHDENTVWFKPDELVGVGSGASEKRTRGAGR